MPNSGTTGTEKKTLKILFWAPMPIFFLVFLRLYVLVFGLIFGRLLSLMPLPRPSAAISVASLSTALVFTVLACRCIYRQFKKHIIAGS